MGPWKGLAASNQPGCPLMNDGVRPGLARAA